MEFTEQLKNCLQEGGAIEWDGAAISIRRDKWGSCPTISKWFNGKHGPDSFINSRNTVSVNCLMCMKQIIQNACAIKS